MTDAVRSRPGWRASWTVLVPVGLVVLAAALRLPNLATRGTWDADQGHDMLTLRAFVRDGVVPLLGPPTSIGDLHHGALYYYLLSPAALIGGGDSPLAVVALIALAGIAAVAVTWWLARSMGGPVAGFVAGLAMAVSTAAVDESTFIWNPNLIALSSAIALAGAWRAWTTSEPRWWLLAAVGTAVTMQCHVLGVTMLPIVAALLMADARARSPGPARSRVWRYGLAGLGIIALAFVPLAIHELTTGFSEIGAALDYIRAGGDAPALGPVARFLVIGIRVVSWPLTGLFTDAPAASLVATGVVIAIALGLERFGTIRERQVARWLGLGLVWTVFALTFIAPSLATVVPGLPNDHYHAFADPMVFALVGLGAGALWRAGAAALASTLAGVAPASGPGAPAPTVAGPESLSGPSAAASTGAGVASAPAAGTPAGVGPAAQPLVLLGRSLVVVGITALLSLNLVDQPSAVHADGGFPAAEVAATRIMAVAGGAELTLRSLPDFKSAEAYAYPLIRAGATVRTAPLSAPVDVTRGALVVICDTLFETAIGAKCGGPAEAVIAPPDRFGQPIDRFPAAPGRIVSVYRLAR